MKGQEFVGSATVQQVLKLIGKENVSIGSDGELLQAYGIFNYRKKDALISVGLLHPLALSSLVEEATNEILRLLANKATQWSFNWRLQKEVENHLVSKFPSLFALAEKEEARLDAVDRIERRITSQTSQMMRNITALISTDEEVKTKQMEVSTLLSEFRSWIASADLTNEEFKTIEASIEKTKDELLAFIEVKKEERPVTLYYYKTGAGVSVKVDWESNRVSYYNGDGKKFRMNKGNDRDEFSRIVSATYISNFLSHNNIRDEDVVVDPRSVDTFYVANGKTSLNLTPSFIDEWYNYDCPSIIRMTPNKHGHTNMIGMKICHFENNLVESNWSEVYIDETMTEEEAKAFVRNHPHTRISTEIRNMLEARRLKESNELEEVKEEVVAMDAKVQSFFEKKKDEVLVHLAKVFPDRTQLKEEDGKFVFSMNDDFGLDCGFTYVHNQDKEYTKKRSILSNASSMSKWMDVNLPYWTQSLTVQREQFKFLREKIQQELGIELYAQHQYD